MFAELPGLTISTAVFGLLLGLSVVIDARTHRIPNALVLPIALCGLLIQVFDHGFAGALSSFAGICVGMLIFLPFHVAGAMGAGDVKLMGAVGAGLGPVGVAYAGLLTLVAGMVLAACAGAHRGHADLAPGSAAAAPGQRVTGKIPYAAAIAAGAGIAMWQLGGLQPVLELIG